MRICISSLVLRDMPDILQYDVKNDPLTLYRKKLYEYATADERGLWLLEHCINIEPHSRSMHLTFDHPLESPVIELYGDLIEPKDITFFKLRFGK